MNLIGPLITAGVIYAATKLKTSNDLKEDLQSRFSVHKFGLDNLTPEIQIAINLVNPSNGELKINSVAGSVIYQGATVGTFNRLESFKIRPRSETDIIVEARLNIGAAVLALFRQGAKQRKIQVKGTFYSELGKLPFDKEIQF